MRFFEFNKSDTDLESALINILLNMKGDADEKDKASDISMDAVKQIMSNTGYQHSIMMCSKGSMTRMVTLRML